MPKTPFEATIEKLTNLANDLKEAARYNYFEKVKEKIEALGQYSGCFYCLSYRQDLKKNYPGVCGQCPCHKLGEFHLGRARSYNGCYVRPDYREMVRLATWFKDNPTTETANSLAGACEKVIEDMYKHEAMLR